MPPRLAKTRKVHEALRAGDDRKQSGGRRLVTVDSPPIFNRGPRHLHLTDEPLEISGPGLKPTSGEFAIATQPEWNVLWVLMNRLKKRIEIDFTYRGKTRLPSISSATQIDFIMLDGSQIAMEIQGLYFHYEKGTAVQVQDRAKQMLLSNRLNIIFIDEDDAMRDPEYYVREALAGRDHSYRYKGYFMAPIH